MQEAEVIEGNKRDAKRLRNKRISKNRELESLNYNWLRQDEHNIGTIRKTRPKKIKIDHTEAEKEENPLIKKNW